MGNCNCRLEVSKWVKKFKKYIFYDISWRFFSIFKSKNRSKEKKQQLKLYFRKNLHPNFKIRYHRNLIKEEKKLLSKYSVQFIPIVSFITKMKHYCIVQTHFLLDDSLKKTLICL
jgi:hypothetical protein